jgi:hypothetical protein
MAHVQDEHIPGQAGTGMLDRPGMNRPERGERNDRGTLKVRPRDDDQPINPDEFKELLDSYDNSFRNIAEG